MPVSCQSVISILENFAPKKLAEDWDSGIGLQIGNPAQPVKRVFVSLDLNIDVLNEAISAEADMLVVHHTPFFKPLKDIRTDKPNGYIISQIVRNKMALYTMHTNLDAVWGGVNDVLAGKLGLQNVEVLSPAWKQRLYKLVVYVPNDYHEQVRTAVLQAGAGWTGNYSDCTFLVNGIGTFRPQEGATPFLGTHGELKKVEEIRLETIVPEEHLSSVVKAMIKAHPYEEVAHDVYRLENEGKIVGQGRIGRLTEPVSLQEFVIHTKECLGIEKLRYCGVPNRKIEKVAVCGGSGMSYWSQALFAGADILLTSDIKYHEAQDALANNLCLVDAGHFATEQPVISVLAQLLEKKLLHKEVSIVVSQISTDPFCYI
ncbi:MAG: Nif3-like dinuclear metal center hexameric protein [Firmicutes bacterium HGW-Firmicutes-12]|nr:MAG: Nif3-like dinuclear metal center hexameric protein [Firmicutes bacterium HGW-Firmicutes-12]